MKSNPYTTLAIITLLIISLFINLPFLQVGSETHTGFSNPGEEDERTLILGGNGTSFTDTTTYFEVPLGQGSVMDAYFNISVQDYNGNHPLNPSVDVGLDGDIDWEFKGTGYSEMGHQTLFFDNTEKKTLTLIPGTNNDAAKIRTPMGAEVNTAKINLTGRMSEPQFAETNFKGDEGLDGAKYIDIGDFDLDGWNDTVVTANRLGKLVWYKNDHTPETDQWESYDIDTNLPNAWDVFVADIDDDGDSDVVATARNSNYGMYWYKNTNLTDDNFPGNGSAWVKIRIDYQTNSLLYPARIFVEDIDDDGDNDTAVCSDDYWNGGIFWFENLLGNGTTWANHTIYTGQAVNDIYVANIDHSNPSRMDIAATLYRDYYVVWFRNDGTPGTAEPWVRYNISYYYRPNCIAVADIDVDGDNDVVVTAFYSGLNWYPAPDTNITNVTQWPSWTQYIISYPYRSKDLRLARINNDTDIDIITNSEYYHDVFYYENPKVEAMSWSYWPQQYVDANLFGATGLAIGDLDKDINFTNDIVGTGYSSSEIKWYENDGLKSPKFVIYYIEEVSMKGPHGIFVADIDKDGNNDIIVTGTISGDVGWWEAPDDPVNGVWTLHLIDRELAGATELYVGDINGDGFDDVAVSAYDGSTVRMFTWYEHPGVNVTNDTEWTKYIIDTSLSYPWGVCIADIDSDGDNDIAATDRYMYDVLWYRNNDKTAGMGDGDGTSWTKFYIDNNLLYYPMGVDVGDIDDDGDPDVVVSCGSYSTTSTGIYWYEAPSNSPSITPWIKHTIVNNIRQIYDVMVFDVDDDNNLDVVAVTYYYGGVFWCEQPDNLSAAWPLHWIDNQNYLWANSLWVDDIGNDGYADIVTASEYYDRVYWYEEPDDPVNATSWNEYIVDTNNDMARGVFIDDINHDGMKDVAAVGYNSNEICWYNISISYPMDISIDIGGTEIYDLPGTLDFTERTNDFASAMNAYLATATSEFEDNYGNEFIDVPLATTSNTRGRIKYSAIDITYDWTATVRKNGQEDLAMEITDLIPQTGTGDHRVYVQVFSETPCKVKVSDLFLEYNGAPDYITVPDVAIAEDTTDLKLLDLTNYFSDDFSDTDELFYSVVNYTNSEYVKVRIHMSKYLSVNATRTPNNNWNGVSKVVVAASDTEGVMTMSNIFNVTVTPVNDPPEMGAQIPDIELIGNGTGKEIVLDGTKQYFTDIDTVTLHFVYYLEPSYNDKLSVSIDKQDENNVLSVLSISEVDQIIYVPLRIICSDEPIEESTMHDLELLQDILVKLVPEGEESEWLAPRWDDITDLYIAEDSVIENWLNLTDMVYDLDDIDANLTFELVSNSNTGYIDVIIDAKDRLDIYPRTNYHGKADIMLKVKDDELNFALESFTIYVSSAYDHVIVSILSPKDEAEVSGLIRIIGTATDIDHTLEKIEIRFEDDAWQQARGRGYWYFDWNTAQYPDGTEVTISARAYDGTGYSEVSSIVVTVDNSLQDSDGDGWADENDKFPNDPSEWKDTDGDGTGDNNDAFPLNPKESLDSDGDEYGDNRDAFPTDPTQHLDKDGDGFGDDLDGNNPDYYPNDKERHAKEDKKEDSDLTALYLWIAVGVFILIDVIIIVWGLLRHRKRKK